MKNGEGDHETGGPMIPPPMLLTPDERIDELITDLRRVEGLARSGLEIGRMTFAHVLNIEASLRAGGVMKAKPWRDVALVAGSVALTLVLAWTLTHLDLIVSVMR